jgi:DNA-binding NarL/FixJ family response regulator
VPEEADGQTSEPTEESAAEAADGTAEPQIAADAAGEPALEAKPERPALVVIDADTEERARVEGFAEALGRPVHAIAPDALRPSALADLANAAAVVVSWDLGGRAGLDVLDAIARRQGATRPRMALASEAATRAMVAAAVRAGAQGFLSRPYDADELAALLEGAP